MSTAQHALSEKFDETGKPVAFTEQGVWVPDSYSGKLKEAQNIINVAKIFIEDVLTSLDQEDFRCAMDDVSLISREMERAHALISAARYSHIWDPDDRENAA